MAVVSVFKDPSRPQSAKATYDPHDNRITSRFDETWIVQVDNKNTDITDIFFATDGTNTIPSAGTAYTKGTIGLIAICDEVHPQMSHESPYVYEVGVSYYGFTLPDSTVKLKLGSCAYPQTCYYDKDNKQIVNSAGQTFEPPLTKTYYDMRFTLSYQTFTTPPIAAIQAAVGKVNSDSVTISAGGFSNTFTSRQLKLEDADCDFEYQGSQYLWTVSTSWIARSDQFVDKLLDQGYCTLTSDNKLVAIPDDNGNALNSQALLDGSGSLLPDGSDPYYFTFKVENEVAMSSIASAFI